jgi:2-iminobutanoate/2-iminopropanoate deaminase
MTDCIVDVGAPLIDCRQLTEGERIELIKLGYMTEDGRMRDYAASANARIARTAVQAPDVLNEAFHYTLPSSFSRGLRLKLGNVVALLISGTASVDEHGKTIHVGNFGAQCWRTYRNISTLLASEGATWHDVVKTTCYLRDIERDYDQFNRIRTSFFRWLQLDPLPASVAVQTRLCRGDLLVEIEAVAFIPKWDPRAQP